MKKLLTMLSALTFSFSITPLTVSCNSTKKEERLLDLESLSADSFEILWRYRLATEEGSFLTLTETKFEAIELGKLRNAILNHMIILLEKEVFGIDINHVIPGSKDHVVSYELSRLFLENRDTWPILEVITDINLHNQMYEIKIKKEAWDDIKDNAQNRISNAFLANPEFGKEITVEKLKSYYDRIQGSSVSIKIPYKI